MHNLEKIFLQLTFLPPSFSGCAHPISSFPHCWLRSSSSIFGIGMMKKNTDSITCWFIVLDCNILAMNVYCDDSCECADRISALKGSLQCVRAEIQACTLPNVSTQVRTMEVASWKLERLTVHASQPRARHHSLQGGAGERRPVA